MPWWFWLLAAGALLIPALLGGVYFWACAAWMAVLTMGVTLIMPGITAWSQSGLWAIGTIVHIALWFAGQARKATMPAAAVGRKGVLVDGITAFERGWVHLDQPLFGERRWPCLCADNLPPGTAVTVIELGPNWLKIAAKF